MYQVSADVGYSLKKTGVVVESWLATRTKHANELCASIANRTFLFFKARLEQRSEQLIL